MGSVGDTEIPERFAGGLEDRDMTTVEKPQVYSRALGTTVDVPVVHINYKNTPPVMWCPHCDSSQQMGKSAVCENCKAMWVSAELHDATERISAASVALGGRPVDVPATPEPPPQPTVPDEMGLSLWSLEELADGAEAAREKGDVDRLLEIRDEMEARQEQVVDGAANQSSPADYDDNDEPDVRLSEPASPDASQTWPDKACTFCAAMPGEPCTVNDGSTAARAPHAIRLQADD